MIADEGDSAWVVILSEHKNMATEERHTEL
jgi:hypothetical protein